MLRFAVPDYLYLLAAIPLLTAVYLLAVRSRRRRLERFGNPQTLAELMPEASPTRMRNKAVFFLTALALLAVAMARPQLGSKLREVEREGVEIMIAVDVSNSMLARDFEPNRLERTKYAVEKVLEGLEEDKVGVIVFAGDAYVQLPITSDYLTARNFVAQISPNMSPSRVPRSAVPFRSQLRRSRRGARTAVSSSSSPTGRTMKTTRSRPRNMPLRRA